MKQVVSAVAGNLPRQLKNFHLIKRQDIYIPFCEIGITCLTKEVTEINLFFETILKLIDIEVSDVWKTFLKEVGNLHKITMIRQSPIRIIGNIQKI